MSNDLIAALITVRIVELSARRAACRNYTLNTDKQIEAMILDKQIEALEAAHERAVERTTR